MQFCKRICLPISYTKPTDTELTKISYTYSNIGNLNKQVLVQRKTQLSVIVFICVLSNCYSIKEYTDMSNDSSVINQVSKYVMLGFVCLDIIKTTLLAMSLYFWNNYKISSRCIISTYCIQFILIAALFIQQRKIDG
jgi:hypothetical protein